MQFLTRMYLKVNDLSVWTKFSDIEKHVQEQYPGKQCVPNGFNEFLENPDALFFCCDDYGNHEWFADQYVVEEFANQCLEVAKDNFMMVADSEWIDEPGPYIVCYFGGDEITSGYAEEGSIKSYSVLQKEVIDTDEDEFEDDDEYDEVDLDEEEQVERQMLTSETSISDPSSWLNYCIDKNILIIDDVDKQYIHLFVTDSKSKNTKYSVKYYEDIINSKKRAAHDEGWFFIEVNAGDIMTETGHNSDNLEIICDAIRNCMANGDEVIDEPENGDKVSDILTVRYFCDNLN